MTAELFWEKHYRDRQTWGGRANPLLIEVATPLSAGTALDLGCGADGDAIWLAQQGWQVTAVDVSPTAVEKVRAHGRPITAAEMALDPRQWPVVRAHRPQRRATGPGGRTATVTDNVLLIRRVPA